MNIFLCFVIFIIAFAANVQAGHHLPRKNIYTLNQGNQLTWASNTRQASVYHLTLVPRVLNYISHVGHLADEAKKELKKSKTNTRPSTLYSAEDIVFAFTSRLPFNVYPASLWKQGSVTRRREFNKVLYSSPPIRRVPLMGVRNVAHAWTKESASIINNNYLAPTMEALEDFSELSQQLLNMTIVRSKEILEESNDLSKKSQIRLQLAHGHLMKAIDREITAFLWQNNRTYKKAKKLINKNFNNAIGVAGKLRLPLESIRHDALQNTDLAKNALEDVLNKRLRHLPHMLRNKLAAYRESGNLYFEESMQRAFDDIFEHLQLQTRATRPTFAKVWKKAGIEVNPSPINYEFWLDLSNEIKTAFSDLGKILLREHKDKLQRLIKKPCSCEN